jgi:outer membrane protein OmpA-like peptidoglycan-associated protein
MNTMDSLRNLVTPDLLSRVSSLLGESEGGTARALGTAFPTILAAMMSKGGDSGAMRQIVDLLGDRTIEPTLARNPASLLAGGGLAKSPIADLSSRFLATLFGSQTSGVASALADHAGIKSSSASTLLGLAAPLVMAVLGDRMRREGLGASGLLSLLSSERGGIAKELPASLGSLVGLGSAARTTVAGAPTYRVGDRHRSRVWLGAAVAGLLALAVLWGLMRGRGPVRVASLPEQPQRLANAVVTDVDTGRFTRRLPNDFELTAPATGIERQIVIFAEDTRKNAETTTWYNFDRLLFETGSATIKPESKAQLKNIAEIMKAYPKIKAKIGGYTDNVGDPASNLKLSQDRAAAVVTELVADGVDRDRLSAEGYGDLHPVADNTTEEGRKQNRRIAMQVTQK